MTDEQIDILLDELAYYCTLCKWSGFKNNVEDVVEKAEKTIIAVSDRLKLLKLSRNKI